MVSLEVTGGLRRHSVRQLARKKKRRDAIPGSYQICAEWLSWRANISLSAAHEKIRTAHAVCSSPS